MNNPTRKKPHLSYLEFVTLMAMMMALTALSTDAMLPALSNIGADLHVQRENSTQLVVSMLFFGLSVGQIIYGPISDSSGRKPAIYAGYALYIIGCLLAIFSGNFPWMLAGRFLQGVGIAGPRSVAVALIRDIYEGRQMARVMSFSMTVFILVPVIAPLLGQGILIVGHWRVIFIMLLILALITAFWFAMRQPETLPEDKRIQFTFQRIVGGFREVFQTRIALGYTLAAGLVFGAFNGYLNSAQQIFQGIFELGTFFPVIFSVVALAIGLASFSNAFLVMRFGMRTLSKAANLAIVGLSLLFFIIAIVTPGPLSLIAFLAYLMPVFFCVGILFGNLNSLAMQPLGHIAGVGAAVIGFLTTFLSTVLGIVIGQNFNDTVLPLIGGFALLGGLSYLMMEWSDFQKDREKEILDVQ